MHFLFDMGMYGPHTKTELCIFNISRGVARGRRGGGGEFGRSVNPIRTSGADFAPDTTASPPGFKKLSTPLISMCLFYIL